MSEVLLGLAIGAAVVSAGLAAAGVMPLAVYVVLLGLLFAVLSSCDWSNGGQRR